MWKKKRGLWTVAEADGKKVADRPHWITILIGSAGALMSPLLGVVAIVVSLQSLQTSQQALKIGQRAYVSVLNGKMTFSNYGIVQDGDDVNHTRLIVRLDLMAVLHNAGNSPATAGAFKPMYNLPDGWRKAPESLAKNLRRASIGEIGPKSIVNWYYTELFELTPDVYHAFRNFAGERLVYMNAGFDYRDVFGGMNPVRWCWVAATNERRTAMTDCQSAHQLMFLDIPR